MPDITLTVRAQNLAAQQFQRLEQDLQRSNRALQNAGRAASDANPAITRLRREYQSLSSDVGNVAAVFRQFGVTFNRQLQGTVNAALQFEQLTKSLQTVSGSTQEANAQMERLVEVARLPGLSLEGAIRASVQLQAIGTAGEEAANVITQFGNALALGGGSSRDLNQITNAIRQMSAEGKILQEDLSIMTTRVAVLVPILQEAFGGTRAEDIRAAGLSAEEFISFVTQALSELPRAGDTAANAIENLSDTSERLQARIGTHLLPAVKDFVGTTESLLGTLLNADPAIQKTIAIAGVLGTTFLTVTAGAAGLTAALPALGAALTFLTANPIGIAITAIAAITAGIVAWKVAVQDTQTASEQLSSALESQDFEVATTAYQGLQTELQNTRSELDALLAQNMAVAESANTSAGALRELESASTQAAESGGFLASLFEDRNIESLRDAPERVQLERRIAELEAQIATAEPDITESFNVERETGEQRGVVTRAEGEEVAPEQRASFGLTIEGEISESDLANINSAVESLSMIGANAEVPQVLRDLNVQMELAGEAILAPTRRLNEFNPVLFSSAEAFERTQRGVNDLDVSLGAIAVTVPSITEALTGTREGIQSFASELIRIEDDLGNVVPLFGDVFARELERQVTSIAPELLTTLSTPLQLQGLIDEIQQARVAITAAQDITSAGIPELQASPTGIVDTLFGIPLEQFGEEVAEQFRGINDDLRDVFVGAFNVSSLVDDVAAEFQGYGRQFGEAIVTGLLNSGATVVQTLTGFVTASFQDLAVTLGGNIGDQISDALSSRILDPLTALVGGGGALGLLGLGAGATALLPTLLNQGTPLTAEELEAHLAAGGAGGGLGIGAGLGQFATGNALQVNVINSEELAARFGITLGESGLLGEEGRNFAQEQADLIAGAIAEAAEDDPEVVGNAFAQAFIDAGVISGADLYTNATARDLTNAIIGGIQEPLEQNIEAVQQGLLEAFGVDPTTSTQFADNQLDTDDFGRAFGLVEDSTQATTEATEAIADAGEMIAEAADTIADTADTADVVTLSTLTDDTVDSIALGISDILGGAFSEQVLTVQPEGDAFLVRLPQIPLPVAIVNGASASNPLYVSDVNPGIDADTFVAALGNPESTLPDDDAGFSRGLQSQTSLLVASGQLNTQALIAANQVNADRLFAALRQEGTTDTTLAQTIGADLDDHADTLASNSQANVDRLLSGLDAQTATLVADNQAGVASLLSGIQAIQDVIESLPTIDFTQLPIQTLPVAPVAEDSMVEALMDTTTVLEDLAQQTAEPAPVVLAEPAEVVVAEPAPVMLAEPAEVVVAEPTPVILAEPAPAIELPSELTTEGVTAAIEALLGFAERGILTGTDDISQAALDVINAQFAADPSLFTGATDPEFIEAQQDVSDALFSLVDIIQAESGAMFDTAAVLNNLESASGLLTQGTESIVSGIEALLGFAEQGILGTDDISQAALDVINAQFAADPTLFDFEGGDVEFQQAQQAVSDALFSLVDLIQSEGGVAFDSAAVLASLEDRYLNQELTIRPAGDVMTVALQGNMAQVEVTNPVKVTSDTPLKVESDTPLAVTVSGTQQVSVDGTVQVTGTVTLGGQAIPVVIQNTESFARQQNQDDAVFNRLGNAGGG